MTDVQQIDMAPAPGPKKSSGYRRLQVRHRELIGAHEALKAEHQGLLADQQSLQADVDKLLQQHRRLMETARAPQPQQPWFESANQVLAELAAAPDQRSLQVMTAAIAGLQQRLAQIIMRVMP
jgi:uncharacterized protein (DUF3084 family)